jgi:hypothetical protein
VPEIENAMPSFACLDLASVLTRYDEGLWSYRNGKNGLVDFIAVVR